MEPTLRILFRTTAGPRRGYGHLVRCLSLARALHVRPLLSLRGAARVSDTALALGGDVLRDDSFRTLAALRPDIVVIDDPIAAAARRWAAAARRIGALVVTIHDLGLGAREGDLVIDGSITRARRGRAGRRAALGPRYAVIDPGIAATRRQQDGPPHVVVALGGGPRVRLARAIAEIVATTHPTATVLVAGGFGTTPPSTSSRVSWGGGREPLAAHLARADVAVVGGGVSLYEACALGIPTVSVPVVSGQLPTVRAFARRGASLAVPFPPAPARTAARTLELLDDAHRRRRMSARSRALVDGYGARRAAAAVLSLVRGGRA